MPKYAPTAWQPTATITVLVPANPKTGKSHARFALYTPGITVAQYKAAVVQGGFGNATLAHKDLRWDVAHGLVSIA